MWAKTSNLGYLNFFGDKINFNFNEIYTSYLNDVAHSSDNHEVEVDYTLINRGYIWRIWIWGPRHSGAWRHDWRYINLKWPLERT